jgi:uncharacterized protein (DUF305 family)
MKKEFEMNAMNVLLASVLVLGSVSSSLSQDAMAGHDMSAMGGGETPLFGSAQVALPEVCRTAAGAMGDMSMGTGEPMVLDQAHTDLMDGMAEMNTVMMTGMMAEDIDVAFVCGMIPHHQSAINMAQAELQHGDDDFAKGVAKQVIDSQQREIDEMLAWLAER